MPKSKRVVRFELRNKTETFKNSPVMELHQGPPQEGCELKLSIDVVKVKSIDSIISTQLTRQHSLQVQEFHLAVQSDMAQECSQIL